MTFLNEDKMKLSVLVVAFLLLASAFTFLPLVGAYTSSTANTVSSPGSISGTTVAIDYPILAGYSVAVTRTITVTNPIGNTPISTFTVSIPVGAVKTGTAPSGAIGAGTTGTATLFGNGPWAIVYAAPTAGGTLIPGGAAVTFTVTFTTESTFATTSGVADAYTLSTAATDTTGASTTLPSLTVYETASTVVTVTGPTGTLVAGTPFTVKVSGTDSGLQLLVTASGSSSNGPNGQSATTTISPTSFTSGPNTGTQSVSVNDTTAETLDLSVTGGTALASSSGGLLTDSYAAAPNVANAMVIHAGAVTSVAMAVVFGVNTFTTTGAYTVINLTNSQGLVPIAGNTITVSTADKYGNPAPFSLATTVTLSAITTQGQTAGFVVHAGAVYGSSYPYTPTGGVLPSLTVTIPANTASFTLNTSTFYFFGVDYGSASYILASSNTLSSGKSVPFMTYTLSADVMTVQASTLSPTAGSSVTLAATIVAAGVQQANIPVNFANTTGTTGTFSNGLTSINSTTSVGTNGRENVSVTFTPSTVAGATVGIAAMNALPTNAAKFAYNTASPTITLTTQGGVITQLVVKTALSAYAVGVGTPTATTVTSTGSLYVAIVTTDAYGNPSDTSANTQIQLSTSGGLSATLLEIANGKADTVNSSLSGLSESIFTPTTGSSFTITAKATVNGLPLTGTTTITVVSPTPLLQASGPTTITTGVPSTISGTANASLGIANNKITSLTYTVNTGSSVSIGFTPAANVAFSFSVLLTKASIINITATDSSGNANFVIVQVPPIAPSHTFNASAVTAIQFTNGPKAVNATYTNNGASSLTVIVVANVLNSQGAIILESTGTITVAAGATVSAFPIIQGIPAGTYSVQVTVYSLQYVTLSQTTSISVTV